MKVGFIGLGTMGASMASNLQAGGHELQVSDVRREAAAAHLKAGATWKDTPSRATMPPKRTVRSRTARRGRSPRPVAGFR